MSEDEECKSDNYNPANSLFVLYPLFLDILSLLYHFASTACINQSLISITEIDLIYRSQGSIVEISIDIYI